MQALQLITQGTPGRFEVREIPDPIPGPDDVLVEVHACGLNHLDLWLEEGGLPIQVPLPRTPGCEAAGVVSQIGSKVRDWNVGDCVTIQSNLTCGACDACLRQEDSMCTKAQLLGVERDGGFADRILIPASQLVPLPDALDFIDSAALSLAGSTAMHMLTDRVKVEPGQTVLVIGGASGVGSAGIQIARELGARVCSTGSTEAKRNLAQSLGAELVVDTHSPTWTKEVRQWTGKKGVDVVLEHVGGNVFLQSLDCLSRGGTLVTCGATAGRDIPLNLWPLFVKQQRIVGSYSRNRRDLIQTLDWAAQGRIKPVIDSVLPLSRASEAYARLRQRDMLGKLVLIPDPLCHPESMT